MLAGYYAARGWDREGTIPPAKLAALDLDWSSSCPELWQPALPFGKLVDNEPYAGKGVGRSETPAAEEGEGTGWMDCVAADMGVDGLTDGVSRAPVRFSWPSWRC